MSRKRKRRSKKSRGMSGKFKYAAIALVGCVLLIGYHVKINSNSQQASAADPIDVGSPAKATLKQDTAGVQKVMQANVLAQSSISIGTKVGDVEKILNTLVVSESQINTHMTPIASADGYVYIAKIEQGPKR